MRRIASFHGLTLFFLVGLMILTLFFRGRIPAWSALLMRYAVFLAILVIIQLSYYKHAGKVRAFIYYFSPILFIISIYESLGDLIQHLQPDFDLILIEIDFAIFGVHPTVWMEQWIVPWLTDLMSLAYLSYYFLPVTLIGILYWQDRTEDLRLSLLVLALSYYLSFIGYILFPAIGPRYTLTHLQSVPLTGSFITDFVRDVLNALEHNKRDCMPSGHTQIALTVLYLAYRYERPLFYLFIPVITGLILSTVYLRYHYVIDLAAGTAIAIGCMAAGPRIHRWWDKS